MIAQLIYAGLMAAQHVAGKRSGGRAASCADCDRTVSADDAVRMKCCNKVCCVRCADRHCTDLGGGEVLVACSCGSRRVSRMT